MLQEDQDTSIFQGKHGRFSNQVFTDKNIIYVLYVQTILACGGLTPFIYLFYIILFIQRMDAQKFCRELQLSTGGYIIQIQLRKEYNFS